MMNFAMFGKLAFTTVKFICYAAFKTLLLLLLVLILIPLTPFLPFTGEALPSDPRFDKTFHEDNLQSETDSLLPLFDSMPPVPIYLKHEPMLKIGTNTERAAAYTFCDNQAAPLIFMKQVFYQKANHIQLVNILKHELTHSWLCRQHINAGHDARFRQKFSQVGGWGN